jgi:hypothetical protein
MRCAQCNVCDRFPSMFCLSKQHAQWSAYVRIGGCPCAQVRVWSRALSAGDAVAIAVPLCVGVLSAPLYPDSLVFHARFGEGSGPTTTTAVPAGGQGAVRGSGVWQSEPACPAFTPTSSPVMTPSPSPSTSPGTGAPLPSASPAPPKPLSFVAFNAASKWVPWIGLLVTRRGWGVLSCCVVHGTKFVYGKAG